MTRGISIIYFSLSIYFLSLFKLNERVSALDPNQPPNIILIVADDVGQGDIPAYFDTSKVEFPNIQNIMDNGVMFTDMHSTPYCAPSRYVLLSGNYQHRGKKPQGSWYISQRHNQFLKHQKSVADALREGADYRTALFGKWHLGGRIPSPSGSQNLQNILSTHLHDWTQPLGEGPQDIGFDVSYITPSGIQDAPYSFFRDGYLDIPPGENITYWNEGVYNMTFGQSKVLESKDGEGSSDWDSTAYNMILVNETRAFLKNHKQQHRYDPFFIDFSMGSIHIPHSPPDYYLDGTPIAGTFASGQMNMLVEMDLVVGSLIDALKEFYLYDNTVIIFTSDNGGLSSERNPGAEELGHYSNGPLRGNKGMIYEGGHRVPFFMSHLLLPESNYENLFPQGEIRDHPLSLTDVYATICDMAGVPIPNEKSAVDSISFLDYAVGSSNENLRTDFGTWAYNKGKFKEDSLRLGNMKLIRSLKTDTIELYDLQNDLSETINLSSKSEYKGLIFNMTQKLASLGPCEEMVFPKYFNIKIGGVKGQRTCEWFIKKPIRCERRPNKAARHCPNVCGDSRRICKQIWNQNW